MTENEENVITDVSNKNVMTSIYKFLSKDNYFLIKFTFFCISVTTFITVTTLLFLYMWGDRLPGMVNAIIILSILLLLLSCGAHNVREL